MLVSLALHAAAAAMLAAAWVAPTLQPVLPTLTARLAPSPQGGGDRPAAAAPAGGVRPAAAPPHGAPVVAPAPDVRPAPSPGLPRDAGAAAPGVAPPAALVSPRGSPGASPDGPTTGLPLAAGIGAFVLPTDLALRFSAQAGDDAQPVTGSGTWTLELRVQFASGTYTVDVALIDPSGATRDREHGTGVLRDFGFVPIAYRRTGGGTPQSIVYDWGVGAARDAAGQPVLPLEAGLQDRTSRLLQAAIQLQTLAGTVDRPMAFGWRLADATGASRRALPVEVRPAPAAPASTASGSESDGLRAWWVCQDGGGAPDDADCLQVQPAAGFLPTRWARRVDGRTLEFRLVHVDDGAAGAVSGAALAERR